MKAQSIFCVLIVSTLLAHCGESSGSGDNADDKDKLQICGDDNDNCVKGTFSQTLKNIETVEKAYDPPSINALSVDESSTNLMADPCQNAPETRLGCEPNTIAAYIDIAKRALNAAQGALNIVEPHLETLDEKSGSFDLGNDVVTYSIESEDQFEFLIKSSGEFDTYLQVEGTKYLLKSENRNEVTGPETTFAEINYVDEQNWGVHSQISSPKCDTRPMAITVDMQMEAGLWLGKAMTYSPDDDTNCTKSESDTARYTDFVGDKTYTTASLYDLSMDFTDFSRIEDYDWGHPDTVNPICIEIDQAPTEDGACISSTTEAVKNATYSDTKFWETPAALQALELTFPDKL